jgi:hypothetical protein
VALVRTDASEEFLLHHQGDNIRSVLRLLVTANVDLSSPILVPLMREKIHSSETSVLKRATRRNIPQEGILHSHLKSYIFIRC